MRNYRVPITARRRYIIHVQDRADSIVADLLGEKETEELPEFIAMSLSFGRRRNSEQSIKIEAFTGSISLKTSSSI